MKSRTPNLQPVIRALVQDAQNSRARLRKLEQHSLILKILIGVIVLLFFIFFWLQLSSDKIITAKQYIVIDQKGNYRCILGPSGLTILDDSMKKRASFLIRPEGNPVMSLFDEKEALRLQFSLDEKGKPQVVSYEEQPDMQLSDITPSNEDEDVMPPQPTATIKAATETLSPTKSPLSATDTIRESTTMQ